MSITNNGLSSKKTKRIKKFLSFFALVISFIIIAFSESGAQAQINLKDIFLAPMQDASKSPLYYFAPFVKPGGIEIAKSPSVKADTLFDMNIQIRESLSSTEFRVYLTLLDEDYKRDVKISVYNLLGKKVMDVYEGVPYKDTYHPINASGLLKGIYICNVVGKNFRLDAKFIVSK